MATIVFQTAFYYFTGSSASKQHLEELAKLLASLYELALMCYDDQQQAAQ